MRVTAIAKRPHRQSHKSLPRGEANSSAELHREQSESQGKQGHNERLNQQLGVMATSGSTGPGQKAPTSHSPTAPSNRTADIRRFTFSIATDAAIYEGNGYPLDKAS